MTSHIRRMGAAAVCFTLMSGTAHAALTAGAVWESWKSGAEITGMTLSAATENTTDGVLTLNGVTLAGEGAPSLLKVASITLTEKADGSVLIAPANAIELNAEENEVPFGFAGSVNHEGLEVIAREVGAGGISYDFAAKRLFAKGDGVMTLPEEDFDFADEAEADGEEPDDESIAEPTEPASMSGSFELTEVSGHYADTPGTNRTFDFDIKSKSFTYETTHVQPMFEMASSSTSEVADPSFKVKFVLPSTIALEDISSSADMRAALDQGLALYLEGSQGVSVGATAQENEFFPNSMTIRAEPATGSVSFDKNLIEVKSTSGAMAAEVTTPFVEVPVEIGLGGAVFHLAVPVIATQTAVDYIFKLGFEQLTFGDPLWNLFDEQSVLSREPVDLNIDVSGKTKVDLVGLIAEGGVDAELLGMPEPESLNIADLSLRLAGAAVAAKGAFTFDNAMGFPGPIGSADVTVTGANRLIEGLINLGILSEDDAMRARMMMAMFMKPGAGPDELVSKIEAKEGFSLFVNGQQIQ